MTHQSGTKIKYPYARKELLRLLAEDQDQLRFAASELASLTSQQAKDQYARAIHVKCQQRAHHVLKILDEVTRPTKENIGLDGSEAVVTLVLHSYLAIMKRVLTLYQRLYQDEPGSIAAKSIPPLYDRVMILEKRKQYFGTNWFVDNDNRPYLIEVEDFGGVNARRNKYGLESVRLPTNMSQDVGVRQPLGKGLAKASHQKSMTDREYESYSKYIKELLST